MKNIKSFEKYETTYSGEIKNSQQFDIEEIIKNASKLIGKELNDKDVIPELRDKIEQSLENGNDDLADKLTDMKKKIENYEN